MPRNDLLFVVNSAPFLRTHRSSLVHAARDAGYNVGIVAPEEHLDWFADAGFATHAWPLDRRSMNPMRELRAQDALTRLYRQLQPELVHHVTIKPVVYGGIAATKAKVPAVVNAVTGLGWAFTGDGAAARVARLIGKAGYKQSFRHTNQRTIFQNDDDARYFTSEGLAHPDQVRVVPGSGIDPNHWAPQPHHATRPPSVVLVGRMLWDKGINTFVEASGHLRGDGIDARMILVGGHDENNRGSIPEERLRTWEASGLIEWVGHQDDMRPVYASASVVCLPSRREGTPRALLEAAACSRPVIATDVPGCREAVAHEETGLLVPPEDPSALAAAIQRLLEDEALATRMGAAGRARVLDRFTEQTINEQTLAIYEELLRR